MYTSDYSFAINFFVLFQRFNYLTDALSITLLVSILPDT